MGHLTRQPLCFFGALAFIVSASISGAIHSVPPNKSIYCLASKFLSCRYTCLLLMQEEVMAN